MSAKGYVVRGKRGSDGAEIAAWTHDGGIGSPVSAARFRTPGQACGAADALAYRGCTDVRIFAAAEDGTETPLPSYEETLAALSQTQDLLSKATDDVLRMSAEIERLRAERDDERTRCTKHVLAELNRDPPYYKAVAGPCVKAHVGRILDAIRNGKAAK